MIPRSDWLDDEGEKGFGSLLSFLFTQPDEDCPTPEGSDEDNTTDCVVVTRMTYCVKG